MRFHSPVLLLAACAVCASLWSLGRTAWNRPGLRPAPPGSARFLALAPAWRAVARAVPARVCALPSSVLPHQDTRCSAEPAVGGAPACSVTPGSAAACSAHRDALQECSAFAVLGSSAECSVLGWPAGSCSVLPPAASPHGVPRCSAASDFLEAATCSVLGLAARREVCSAANPGTKDGFCSAAGLPGASVACSVLRGLVRPRNACSAGFAPGQSAPSLTCSSGPGGTCSVALGEAGACTSFKAAPPGSCSTQGGGACSVLGGAPGGPVCRLP